MTIDRQIKYVLGLVEKADYPEFHRVSAEEARQIFETTAPTLNVPAEEVFQSEDRWINGSMGNVQIRIYTPHKLAHDELLPIMVFYHGGGFVIGSLNSYDNLCRYICNRAKCIVVSVDYRLAPEHKFPAAVDDALTAYKWISRHAKELNGDPQRIAIAGDSAGGNLAAVTAIGIRDHGEILPLLQILIYPVVGGAPETPSHYEFAEGFLLTRSNILWFYKQYLSKPEDAADPRFALVLTENPNGLPEALVIIAGHDPLRDEGFAYANLLAKAGVPVEIMNYEKMVHGFISLAGAVDQGKEAIDKIVSALSKVFDGDSN